MYLTGYTTLMQGKGGSLPYAENDGYKGIYSPMISVNRIFYSHGHCFIYDYMTLKLMLEKQGFVNVKKEQFGTGRNPELLIDSTHRACESLYVEASV